VKRGFYVDEQGRDVIEKQPTSTLDYGVDWSQWLKGGDVIVNSTWTVPGGLTKGAESISSDKRRTAVILGGGSTPLEYQVTNVVVTAKGLTDGRSFIIKMVDN
jgi:hypothetical protein